LAEHPHAALLRSAHEAFSRGDTEALKRIIDPEIVWEIPGRSLVSGRHRGYEELFAYFGKLQSLTGDTFKVSLNDTLVSDRHVVLLEAIKATREGKTLDVELVLIAQIRDGRITHVRDRFSDQYAWDEFWA
jgi:hypothetical protein